MKKVELKRGLFVHMACKMGLWFQIFRSYLSFHKPSNGADRVVTFRQVYEKYCALHLPTVTESTRVKYIDRAERFFCLFWDDLIANFTPEKIAEIVKRAKEAYIENPYARRYSFEKELKDLKALLTWYSEHYDFKFRQPVRPFHVALSVLSEIPDKERKISMEETLRFFAGFPQKSLYHDMAVTQFYCGGRIGEIAGIQIKNIDLKSKTLRIKEVLTWINGYPKVKNIPKNGKLREVFLNETLIEILSRRVREAPAGCIFAFNDGGEPLRYNRINLAYNRAWREAGLSQKFSGSHLMRFSSAQAARKLTGSLDAAAAVTGHSSMAMAAHYGRLDSNALNQSSVIEIEKFMHGLSSCKTVEPNEASIQIA